MVRGFALPLRALALPATLVSREPLALPFDALAQQAIAATARGERALEAEDADLALRLFNEGLALTLHRIRVDRSVETALHGVGRALFRRGQRDEAAKCFNEALVTTARGLAPTQPTPSR